MKNHFSKIKLVCLFFALMLVLSGCTPSGYTSAAAKDIASQHKVDAQDWFADNLSDAKVTSAKAVTDTCNLFFAVQGTFSISKKEYHYLYDCNRELMYTDMQQEHLIEGLGEAVATLYGIEGAAVEITLRNHPIELLCQNDAVKPEYGHAFYGDIANYQTVLFLSDSKAEDLLESILYGDEPICEFSAKANVEEIPEYIPTQIQSISGLSYISFLSPMDFEYEGTNYAVHYREEAMIYHTHLKRAEDNLYVGYTYRETRIVNENDDIEITENNPSEMGNQIEYERIADNEFVLTIPKGASQLFIAPRGKYIFTRTVTSATGEDKVIDIDMDKGDRNKSDYFTGYDILNARYIVPRTNLYCYTDNYDVKTDDGKYHIKK